MSIYQTLELKFRQLESNTVSNSFGGKQIDGKAPVFTFKPIMEWLGNQVGENEILRGLSLLKKSLSSKAYKYTLECMGRFAFCIELTNLNITSTKMKTRWVPGRITKTKPGTFENYEGDFKPGEDQRSSTFEDCLLVLKKCIDLLNYQEKIYLEIMEYLSLNKHRGTPYESVFTYINPYLDKVHLYTNIRLVNQDDIIWLIKARPIIHSVLRKDLDGNKTKVIDKISTKCYKTDRSQTGEVQTNRAKRWECLSIDFQHATIEDCWSVERKLLNDVTHFEGFPVKTSLNLNEKNLTTQQDLTVCPIILKPLLFSELLGGGSHGQSSFQVGHLLPLKAKGKHTGSNIEWISNDGNRIQGSLNIQDTRKLLNEIFDRMIKKKMINKNK